MWLFEARKISVAKCNNFIFWRHAKKTFAASRSFWNGLPTNFTDSNFPSFLPYLFSSSMSDFIQDLTLVKKFVVPFSLKRNDVSILWHRYLFMLKEMKICGPLLTEDLTLLKKGEPLFSLKFSNFNITRYCQTLDIFCAEWHENQRLLHSYYV